jgi:hypothetical protein
MYGAIAEERKAIVKEVLLYLLDKRLHHLPEEDTELGAALSWGLHCAVERRWRCATEIILEALYSLGYGQNSSLATLESTSEVYAQACDDEDWTQAASLLFDQA